MWRAWQSACGPCNHGNRTGQISLEEIRKAIVDGVNSWAFVDEKQAEYLFESFDQDHNGYAACRILCAQMNQSPW